MCKIWKDGDVRALGWEGGEWHGLKSITMRGQSSYGGHLASTISGHMRIKYKQLVLLLVLLAAAASLRQECQTMVIRAIDAGHPAIPHCL